VCVSPSLVSDGTRYSLRAMSARGIPLGPLEKMVLGQYDTVSTAEEQADGGGEGAAQEQQTTDLRSNNE